MKLRRISSVLLLITFATFSTAIASAVTADDVASVKIALAAYNDATQRLDVSDTSRLFTADSEIVESGSVEGTFANYLEHHIGPELTEFKSFTFSDYKVDVAVERDVAFATESFRFRIEPKSGDLVERLAVATSVLKRVGGKWLIFRYHWSSRRPAAAPPAKP